MRVTGLCLLPYMIPVTYVVALGVSCGVHGVTVDRTETANVRVLCMVAFLYWSGILVAVILLTRLMHVHLCIRQVFVLLFMFCYCSLFMLLLTYCRRLRLISEALELCVEGG